MIKVLITCEHATNKIPTTYRALFKNKESVLKTHRAYDIGILGLAKKFARQNSVSLRAGKVSRLLIDLNRELESRTLFSEFSRKLPLEERDLLIKEYHALHFYSVENYIQQSKKNAYQVIHLGVHSFTPRLFGKTRTTEVGLLFDPGRASESKFVNSWMKALKKDQSFFRIKKNYPYHGKGSGLVSYLRKKFSDQDYVGIELEVNQKFYTEKRLHSQARVLEALLLKTFRQMIINQKGGS